MLRKVTSNKWVGGAFAVSFALIIGSWLWAWFTLKGISQSLILHYNSFAGINQSGTVAELSAVSVMAFVALVVNSSIAFELQHRNRFLALVLAVGSILFSLLIFIAFTAIIRVN